MPPSTVKASNSNGGIDEAKNNTTLSPNQTSPSSQFQYPSQTQAHVPAHPFHRLTFGNSPSANGQPDARRDSNNESWSGDESPTELDGQEHDSKKRKRPMSVSCELCKQRKVKCDRGHPVCGWCQRNNQICEYKERKKPGLRAGYGRELEARLDRLEAVISSQQNTLSQLANGAMQVVQQQASQQETNVFASGAVPLDADFIERPELPPIQQLSNVFTPRTPAMVGYRSEYGNFPGGYMQQSGDAYQKQGVSSLQQQETPSHYSAEVQSMATPSLEMPTPGSTATVAAQDHDFPPYDLLYTLTDLYFKHVNTWCPILHRRTTFDSLFGTSSLDEADRIMLHAIVATTIRFSTDSRLSAERKDRYYQSSKRKVLLYGLENSSVKALQALVILALDLCGTTNGPPSWNVLALIARSAVQLGLSIEATSPSVSPRVQSIYTLRAMVLSEPTSWIEDESRRRLFWMVYIIDRYATVCTAFDFALDEKEIDRKLPCRDDLFARNQPVETRWFRSHERADSGIDRPENLGSFSYYVEVVGILSQIHQFLKKPVDIGALGDVEQWQSEYRQLHSELNAWKNSLPKEYSNTSRLFDNANKANNCGWIMLHATYHTTVIRLHSSAAYPARRSPIFSPSFRASQCCLNAVDAISTLCGQVRQHGMLSKLGWPFAFSVWVAARLLLVHSSTIDHNINPTIHFFLTILRELGAHWAVAGRYAELLQRVLDEFAESERVAVSTSSNNSGNADTGTNTAAGQQNNNNNSSDRGTPSSVRILADMRRCAYDLDFLISRQPRMAVGVGPGGSSSAAALAAGGLERFASAGPTPSRTPAPNELEYLDVFDFFNLPRLPLGVDATAGTGAAVSAGGGGGNAQAFGYTVSGNGDSGQAVGTGAGAGAGVPSGVTTTTDGQQYSGASDAQQQLPFVWDVSADWFVPLSTGGGTDG